MENAVSLLTCMCALFHLLQVGSLVGSCLKEEPCPITILKKMPGKAAKAALRFQFVKFKVGMDCLILDFECHGAKSRLSFGCGSVDAFPQFIPLMLRGLTWPYQESSTFTYEQSMQPRGRNGWWRSERPKLASQITGQREKRVFGCRRIHVSGIDRFKGFKQPRRHLTCRAPGEHGCTENKDVRTPTLLWPSPATSE